MRRFEGSALRLGTVGLAVLFGDGSGGLEELKKVHVVGHFQAQTIVKIYLLN